MRRRVLEVCLPLALLAAAPSALADDEKIFTLKFTPERPFRVQVGHGTHEYDVFWVLPYWLENTSSTDRQFHLTITGESDKGVTYRDNSYGIAYERIRRHLNLRDTDELWWHDDVTFAHQGGERQSTSVPLVKRAGPDDDVAPKDDFPITLNLPTIEAGKRVQCVAVFRNLDREMDDLVVTIHGLNNIRKIEKVDAETTRLTERVLKLSYSRPGDELYTITDVVRFVGKEWVDVTREYRTDTVRR